MSAREREYRRQRLQDRLGDAPVEAQYHAQMAAVARALDTMFNGGQVGKQRKTGFILMVFPFADKGRCNYISNGADRRDVVTLMKEMIARFEGQPEHKEGRA